MLFYYRIPLGPLHTGVVLQNIPSWELMLQKLMLQKLMLQNPARGIPDALKLKKTYAT